MRFVPALALSLAASTAMLAVPAPAKEKAAAPAKQNYSAAFLPNAQAMEKASKAKDNAGLKAAIDKAASTASTPDDNFLINYYRFQLASSTSDEAMQKAGVDGMLASGKAPADLTPKLEGMAGQFALKGGDVDGAIGHLEKAVTDPQSDPNLKYLLAEAYFSKGVKVGGGQSNATSAPLFQKGLTNLQAAIDGLKAQGKPVPASYYDRGATVARAVGGAEGQKWAMSGVQQGSSPQAWNSLLTGYLNGHKSLQRGEALDVYRLMLATGGMVQPADYAEYADAASKGGLVGEAKAVIDSGRAAGTLQPTQLTQLYQAVSGEVGKDRAGLPSSEAAAAKAADGRVAASTASAYLGYGDYAKSAQLSRLALQKGGVDTNEVNTRLGIALAKGGDFAGAKAAFGKVTGGSRKEIADFWMTYVNSKSGGTASAPAGA